MKLAKWGLAILLVSPCAIATARAQDASQSGQQQDALALAARRAREQKKDEAKAAKVWDNDNIPTAPGSVSVVGESNEDTSAQTSTESDQGQQQSPAPNEQAKPEEKKDKAAISSDLDAAKQQLASAKTDLDILQRKLALDNQMFYINPNYASDTAGAAALQDEQSQIDAKQQQIADIEKKVDDLQSQLDAASSDSNTSQN